MFLTLPLSSTSNHVLLRRAINQISRLSTCRSGVYLSLCAGHGLPQ